MTKGLISHQVRNFINLRGEPITLVVSGKEQGAAPKKILLDPVKPEEWVRKDKYPPDPLTMLIVDEKSVEMANEIHRTTADMALMLLDEGEEPGRTEQGELVININELQTVSGHAVELVA